MTVPDRLETLLAATASFESQTPPKFKPKVLPGTRLDRDRLTGFIVYQLFDANDELLYVGQTTDLANRLGSHHKDRRFGHLVHHTRYEQLPTEREMLTREAHLIRDLQPRFNEIGGHRQPASPTQPTPIIPKPKGLTPLQRITNDYIKARDKAHEQQALNALYKAVGVEPPQAARHIQGFSRYSVGLTAVRPDSDPIPSGQ